MHGRLVLGWAKGLVLVVVLAVGGCADAPPPPAPDGPLGEAAGQFDPATAGTIAGRVTWDGPLPDVPPFRAPVSPLSDPVVGKPQSWPNPHAPVIDPSTRGVAGAVIFLRGIDARRGRPWDHPPVTVELRDYQIHILQGDADLLTGFVRRGTPVTFTSGQPVIHSVQARGAAFFSLAFPPGARPCVRTLERGSVVELSSGVGHFWMRGHLFVDDHPYFTRTDGGGRFTLEKVPPGCHEIVCWHPDWHEAGHERDADTGLITRLTFGPPVTVTRPVVVETAGRAEVVLRLAADLFGR
jgi:hypothetical protein